MVTMELGWKALEEEGKIAFKRLNLFNLKKEEKHVSFMVDLTIWHAFGKSWDCSHKFAALHMSKIEDNNTKHVQWYDRA